MRKYCIKEKADMLTYVGKLLKWKYIWQLIIRRLHKCRESGEKMRKRCIGFLTALVLAASGIAVPASAQETDVFPSWNVASGRQVEVSSVEAALPGNVGALVVDGDNETRWSCAGMKTGTSEEEEQNPQWLVIDLEAPETSVDSITINFYKKVWGAQYKIQTASTNDESTQWKDVASIEHAGGSLADDYVEEITDVGTLERYVRFYFEKVNPKAAGTGISIREIKILGTQLVSGNISLNKPAEVSTVEILMPQNVAENTVDGDSETRWSSERMKNNGITDSDPQTPQWLLIDLGAEKSAVDEIRIDFYLKVWATKYRIETADSSESDSWITVAEVDRTSSDGADDQTDTFSGDQLQTTELKRFVRFYFEKINVNAGGNGVSVREVTINGTQPYVSTTEDPVTAEEVLDGIGEIPSLTAESTRVELPEVPDGFEIAVVGSDKEQVISNSGEVTDRNIGDREVTILVEVRSVEEDGGDADTARKNFTLTVPSKNSLYPEYYPEVENPNGKPAVIPTLQEWYGCEGEFTLQENSRIIINDAAGVDLQAVAENMQEDLAEFAGVEPAVVSGEAGDASAADIYIESQTEDIYDTGEEGYFMTVDENGVRIYSSTYTGALYGTVTAEQILWQDEGNDNIPCGVIRDYPDYEIRGVMFDVGRIPHRLQYLQDYTKILTWYKMNEFQLHLNDDFTYSPEGLPSGSEWNGMHRLESDAFPSLTDNRVYSGERFEYFNEEYSDPVYTKDDYRELEDMANAGGINLIPEFDTPSHSNAYIKYAQENPDDIDWLGPIQSNNDPQMLALDINSSNADEAKKAKTARKFMETLYEDYLGGDDPVFSGDTVNVGADEYWDKSNPEAYRQYVVFLDELMRKYGKTTRMWGALKLFPGETEISPDNIILDIWATYEDDPIARMSEGFRVVNLPQPYLYTTPGRDHKDMIVEEWLYKNWDPTIFNGDIKADEGEPLLLGAKAALWGDEFREGITEADLHERMLRSVAMVAEKTWGGSEKTDDYIAYQETFDRLQEGPGTQIAMTIESKTDVVVDYDMSRTEETEGIVTVKDSSGNGYDAQVINGKAVEVDGEMMIEFDGSTLMTTPLHTLSYPYTVSFDVKASEGNTKDSLLFSGYDGQLLAKGLDNDCISLNRSLYHQSFDYEIPEDESVTVTIVGTARNTKMYVDGQLVKMLYSSDTGKTDEYFSTFVFPMEEIGKDFHGYIGNIKAYNKALEPDMIRTDAADVTEVNVALNRNAYSERFGNQPDLNTGLLKYHPASKATDGDKADAEAEITSTDPNSYWISSNNNSDYLMVDLGEERQVSRVVLTWEGQYTAGGFDIQVSTDGAQWQTVKQVRGNTSSVTDVTLDAPAAARYVKMQGVSRNSTYYGVREMEVYETVDRSGLSGLLTEVRQVIADNDLENSDDETAAALTAAVIPAENTLENAAAAQKEITAALTALSEKYEAYKESAQEPDEPDEPEQLDTDILEYAVELASSADTTGVVPAAAEKFESAYTAAQDLLERVETGDPSVTQQMIEESWKELITSMQYLSFRQGDKSDLEKVVAMAESLDLEKYMEEGRETFVTALSNAQAVLSDENAMQDSVDPAWRELLRAMSDLRLKPDRSALEELIAQARGLNEADYEETSFRAMLGVLAEAQAVCDDGGAAQEEIDEAASRLQEAVGQLTAKADDPKAAADTAENTAAQKGSDDGGSRTASAGGGTKGGAETSVSADKAVKTGDASTAVLWAAAVLAAAAVILQAGKKIK